MSAAAAFIFPTTLSIISQTSPDGAARAKAIGASGAATGVAVALGPIVGGELLAHFWWGSIFLAMVPVAALTMIGALVLVPADRNPASYDPSRPHRRPSSARRELGPYCPTD